MLEKAKRCIVKYKRFPASAEPVNYKAFKQSNAKNVISKTPGGRTQIQSTPSAGVATLKKSGTSESNREPPAPKAGVLPSAPLPEFK